MNSTGNGPTDKQRENRRGIASEALVASMCVLGSNGQLNVATSWVDDEGVDLVFYRWAGGPTLSVQVKSNFFDAPEKIERKGAKAMLNPETFRPRRDLYLLFLVVDQFAAQIQTAWFVPSVEFSESKTGKNRRFQASPDRDSGSPWADYLLDNPGAGELANRIMSALEGLEWGHKGDRDMWTAMVWNMNWNQNAAAAKDAYLQGLLLDYSVDVALLNEARINLLTRWQKADPNTVLFNAGGTVGKDYTRKVYSAAVYSKHGPVEIRDAKAESLRGRRPKIDFAQANSRPGSWIAATVSSGRGPVSCISLYGFCDELGDASMHRSLSEVSPIFSDPNYCELVLLGGDFNTFTGHALPGHAERDRVTLERIKAYGLVDCLAKRAKGPLEGCPCQKVSELPCTHTLTRLIPGDDTPYQEDYLFASQALAGTLDECFALKPEEWRSYSDHAPIIATFKI